jgi:hypothetical protein
MSRPFARGQGCDDTLTLSVVGGSERRLETDEGREAPELRWGFWRVASAYRLGVGHWPEHLHVVPGGDGIQQLRCGISAASADCPLFIGRTPRARSDDRPQGTRCVTMRNAADRCALLVPMDTTTMIGATGDQSHRHEV